MKGKGQILVACSCCGTFSASSLCVQCAFAGCGKKKKGERCYLRQPQMTRVSPVIQQ